MAYCFFARAYVVVYKLHFLLPLILLLVS